MKSLLNRTVSAIAIALTASAFFVVPASADSFFGKKFDQFVDGAKELPKKVIPSELYDAQKDAVNGATEAAKDALEKSVKVVAPAAAFALDLVQGDTPKEAFSELVEDYKAAISAKAKLPIVVAEGVEHTAAAGVEAVAGEDAANAVRIVQLPNQVLRRIPATTIDSLFKVSEGEDLQVVLGVPLASAIEQAIAYYAPNAKPLPNSVKVLLKQGNHISEDHLHTVRYIVDSEGGTIAAVINRLMKEMGHASASGNHAVAIGNIIVFAKEPHHDIKDVFFWAHEVHHTVQYAAWGIPEFASRYTTSHGEVEVEADRVADAVFNEVVRITEVFMAATASN